MADGSARGGGTSPDGKRYIAPTDGRPIDTSVVTGVRNLIARIRNAWLGPGQPVASAIPAEAQPRKFQYPVGFNIASSPRSTESIGFAQLRALANADEILRMIIETRKDQMAKLKWTVKPKPKRGETRAQTSRRANDPRIDQVEQFLQRPDGRTTWQNWLRQFLEELFVIDAPAIFVQRNLRGDVMALELLDGATLKPIVDDFGRIVAYQQWLYGIPGEEFALNEIVYAPRNPRVSRFYGFSPVEQLVILTNIALRRQAAQLAHYTIGNIPEGFMEAPATWTPDQIEAFEKNFDALLSGNQAQRAKMKMVPSGAKPLFPKIESLKTDEDEWWVRLKCYCFSVSPQPFIKMMNRATAQNAQEASLEEGLLPLMDFVESVFTERVLSECFGYDDLMFSFEFQEDVDQEVQARIDASDVTHGIRSIDEVREQRGLDPIGVGPGIITMSGFVPLEPAPAIPVEAPKPEPLKLLPGGQADDGKTPAADEGDDQKLAAKFDAMRSASRRAKMRKWYGDEPAAKSTPTA